MKLEKITDEQRNYIMKILERVIELHNEGNQIFFEFDSHVNYVTVFYYVDKDNIKTHTYKFEECYKILDIMEVEKTKIYNRFE